MLRFRLVLAALCVGLLVVIGAQNTDTVELQFLTWSTSLSLVVLVFLTAGAGFVLGFVAGKSGSGAPKL